VDRSAIPALLTIFVIVFAVAAFLTDGTLSLVLAALAIIDAVVVWLLSPKSGAQ
jgi:hypothetical protein